MQSIGTNPANKQKKTYLKQESHDEEDHRVTHLPHANDAVRNQVHF